MLRESPLTPVCEPCGVRREEGLHKMPDDQILDKAIQSCSMFCEHAGPRCKREQSSSSRMRGTVCDASRFVLSNQNRPSRVSNRQTTPRRIDQNLESRFCFTS